MANYTPRPTPLPSNRTVKDHFTMLMVYEALLYEINKTGTRTIDVDTFNHFFSTANDNYYKKRYNLYDSGQQTSDDMRDISARRVYTATSSPALNVSNEQIPLPTDYYHLTSLNVFWKVLNDFKTFRKDETANYPVERISVDRLGFLRKDHYLKPSYKKPYYHTEAKYIQIESGRHENMRLDKVDFTYLMLPEEVQLREEDLDDTTTDISQVLRQGATITYEVLKELSVLVLENSSDPRTASKMQVDQAVPSQLPQQPQPAARR